MNVAPVGLPLSARPPTAFDLLQNLMLDNAQPAGSPKPGQNFTTSHPPSSSLLFGGEPGGANIWTMTREESEKGTKRNAPGQSASALASVKNIWNDPAAPGVQHAQPQAPAPTPFGAWAPRQETSIHEGYHAATAVPQHAGPWSGYDAEVYQQYYAAQPSHSAQWAQTYHPS